MANEKRIYLITHTHGAKERLIEATSRNAAITYAVKTSIKADLASQRDLIRLTSEGVHKKSKTKRAIEWVAQLPAERTDAEAARKFKLKSPASISRYRKSAGIGRDGLSLVPVQVPQA